MKTQKELCPNCNKKTGVPIVYGLLSEVEPEKRGKRGDWAWEIKRGEWVSGGCMIPENYTNRRCTSCEHEWLTLIKAGGES